ncbi:hypothetical protein Cni_G18650 [Canna indica]|uniref:C2H2-type domain-containing protein n=1 Tax=Canna indica TaxID=4628 RepID=A0AAQ3KJL2_9LILI|nr:hypothetical protein Cni_G18650 [Canna indica]
MIPGTSSCFPNNSSFHNSYQGMDDILYSPARAAAASGTDVTSTSHALFYNLSVLKEKVQQLESIVSIMISPNRTQLQESMAGAGVSSLGNMVQEIIFSASSLSCTLQQLTLNTNDELPPHNAKMESSSKAMDCSFNEKDGNLFSGTEFNFSISTDELVVDNGSTSNDQRKAKQLRRDHGKEVENRQSVSDEYDEIIELDAADLLAKYTHYCQLCGKGFRRDANLRMHMRAHGDEYKSAAALANPTKSSTSSGEQRDGCGGGLMRRLKYSCPQEGCRWNRKHAKFQALKSMVCLKNHYKRSHCAKMYVCKRCNLKQFAVLSDLRTHEKYCGERRWRCSCGTSFARKDKLMSHVALFAGHAPELNCLTN